MHLTPSPQSPKGQAIRRLLRAEFDKNRGEEDPAKIEELKSNAVRGLSNYVLQESGSNDPRLRKRMDTMRQSIVRELREDAPPR
ncbi:unnamed protein product [Phaeothamnion confervicola]